MSEVRLTKDITIVVSSQPRPDLLTPRFQNLKATKTGVKTKNKILGE
jgi:hypothetical protein